MGIVKDEKYSYSSVAPFFPPKLYPEYPFKNERANGLNTAYDGVRTLMGLLNFDEKNVETKDWNPLGDFIKPGDTVLIKPNFVIDNQLFESTITHPSIIRAIIDYIVIAQNGRGVIIIADAPQENANMERILKVTQLRSLIKYYNRKGIKVRFLDLRIFKTDRNFMHRRRIRDKFVKIDLGNLSFYESFSKEDYRKIYGAYYDVEETRSFHSEGHHEYWISPEVLDADVIITLPKMKVHRKVGVTLSLKNTVGILANKNCLPHYRLGYYPKGDAYPPPMNLREKFLFSLDPMRLCIFKTVEEWLLIYNALYSFTRKLFKVKSIGRGDWYGNDTVWRGALDLNTILFYADSNGDLRSKPQREYFTVVDGIIGGEGEGPVNPVPKICRTLLAGSNPALVDMVGTMVMGFDYRKIPLLRNAIDSPLINRTGGTDILVKTNYARWESLPTIPVEETLNFKLPEGWESWLKEKDLFARTIEK